MRKKRKVGDHQYTHTLPQNENSYAEKFENHLSVEACAAICQTVA